MLSKRSIATRMAVSGAPRKDQPGCNVYIERQDLAGVTLMAFRMLHAFLVKLFTAFAYSKRPKVVDTRGFCEISPISVNVRCNFTRHRVERAK